MQMNDHSSRAHALLSASSSSRWLACPPSAVAATMYPQQDTEFTREGTLAHEVAEIYARGDVIDTEALLPEVEQKITPEMVRCAEAYRDYIQEQTKSPDAVVLLEQRLDFSPWVPDGFGTGDCCILQGMHLDVIDYKYGRGVAVSAEGNSQLRLYGLGAIHCFGEIYEIETISLHIFQPRIDNVSVETLPVSELLAWGEDVKPRADLASEGKGEMSAGPHCRFCPHAGACPKLASTCMEVPLSCGGVANVGTMGASMVASVLEQEPMITAWLKAVKERALSSLLAGEEIPGYKVVSGRVTRSWADELEVARLLTVDGIPLEKFTETKLLSPSQMEKALGKKKVAELLSGQILAMPGSPTVAPASDKRKPFDRLAEARKDFE